MTGGRGPFALAAHDYISSGWLGALPLPVNRKSPVPEGYTGWQHYDIDPRRVDIDKWARDRGLGNIALRMPRDIIGIDVDAYGDKPGAQSLREAEERWGPLPATWMTTSRDDGVSGIRYFRIPEGLKWPSVVGPGIELVHRGHRYAVAPPSVHPDTKVPYLWVDPRGNRGFAFPRPSTLPELPRAWVAGLTSGETRTAGTARSEVPKDAQAWITPGEPCAAVLGQVERVRDALSARGSRHDAMRDLILAVMFLGQQGHEGVGPALQTMHRDYVREVGKDRPDEIEHEWSSMMAGAFGIIAANPRMTESCAGETCGNVQPFTTPPELTGPQWVVDPEAARTEAARERDVFFDSRPELAHIRDFARARMTSPWATLGAVLVRAIGQIPPMVVLPGIIGGEASLNLFVTIVGRSGSGKQAAERVAEEAFYYGSDQAVATLGSGEGIVHSFVRHVKAKGEEPAGLDQHETSVIFRASEIDTLAALKGRSSATIMPTIRDAWNGDELGFAYAAEEKRLRLRSHSYRLGLIVGAQPTRCDALLGQDESEGGTPQRFLWMPAVDDAMPTLEEVKSLKVPDRWQWVVPRFRFNITSPTGRKPMDMPEFIKDLVIQAAIDRGRGDVEALDGHALLNRIKVAAALAILAGKDVMDASDWDLSAHVMAVSDRTRESVLAEMREAGRKDEERRINYKQRETMAVEEASESAATRRLLTAIELRLADGQWMTAGALRKSLTTTKRRELFDEMIGDFVERGWFEMEVEEHPKVPDGITRYRLPGGKPKKGDD